MIIGPPGIGKSLLVNGLTKQLSEASLQFIRVDYPLLSTDELLADLAMRASKSESEASDKLQHLTQIEKWLSSVRESASHAVIVIEEAHLLQDPSVAESLRIIPFLGGHEVPGATMLLVGQSTLAPWLNAFPAWEAHFGAKCHLPALTCDETMGYVAHRLRAAGATKNVFTNKAIEALHHLSGGVPRRINRLADLALLVGFAEDIKQVDLTQIEAVAEELALGVD